MSMSEYECRRDEATISSVKIDLDDIDVTTEKGYQHFTAKGHAVLYKGEDWEIDIEVFNDTDENHTFKVEENSPDHGLIWEYVHDLLETGELQ